jgi:histidine phosphotransferase ChpT
MTPKPDFSALITSRICHDLVNPISAISNGVELMLLDGAEKGPELALIAESAVQANARIRFFRIAFGAGGNDRLSRAEVQSVLEDVARGGRLAYGWHSDGDLARGEVRLAFLAIQCCETSMPYGGSIAVNQTGERWHIAAQGSRFKVDPALWGRLTSPRTGGDVAPAHVHFALLPDAAEQMQRRLQVKTGDAGISISF